MDLQGLLCGFYPRNGSAKPKKQKQAKRKHLPTGTGAYTVACVDIMSGYGGKALFLRLYYPTNSSDIFVSMKHNGFHLVL